jgi:hypothetical protein
VFVNGNISLSPVILDWIDNVEIEKLEEFMED